MNPTICKMNNKYMITKQRLLQECKMGLMYKINVINHLKIKKYETRSIEEEKSFDNIHL